MISFKENSVMTDDVILGMGRVSGNTNFTHPRSQPNTAKQIKMRQFTVSQNHLKRGFVQIAKDEFNTKICTTTVHMMLCKQEFGMFKVMPYDYTQSQGFTESTILGIGIHHLRPSVNLP